MPKQQRQLLWNNDTICLIAFSSFISFFYLKTSMLERVVFNGRIQLRSPFVFDRKNFFRPWVSNPGWPRSKLALRQCIGLFGARDHCICGHTLNNEFYNFLNRYVSKEYFFCIIQMRFNFDSYWWPFHNNGLVVKVGEGREFESRRRITDGHVFT